MIFVANCLAFSEYLNFTKLETESKIYGVKPAVEQLSNEFLNNYSLILVTRREIIQRAKK